MDKKLLFLIIFSIIIFGLRLFNINEAIYDDESNFAYSLTVMDEYGFNHNYYSPQPLNFIYKPFIALFGLETWVFRIVPWLFGIINTIFVYIFARRHWNKDVAFWASFLMLVSFYPTLASLQFDVEGNLVMFCVMLMFFSYLEYGRAKEAKDKRKQLGWQILSGIGLGIAVISKYNSVYIVLILAVYSLIKEQGGWWEKIKKSFNNLFMIYLAGFVLFLSNCILGIIASPSSWLDFIIIISWQSGFSTAYQSNYFSFLGLIIYMLWSTLLLMGFYVLSLFWEIKNKVNNLGKNNLILKLWISIALLFYLLVMSSGSIDRYLMNTIPALAILGGYFINNIEWKNKEYLFLVMSTIAFTFCLFLVNLFSMKSVARFPNLYFNELKNLNFNWLFAITSASGPTFGVNFATIFWSFALGFLFLSLYLLFSKKDAGKWFFMLFLSVSLAFNVFLVSEYIFHPTGVNVSDVKWEMINYVKH